MNGAFDIDKKKKTIMHIESIYALINTYVYLYSFYVSLHICTLIVSHTRADYLQISPFDKSTVNTHSYPTLTHEYRKSLPVK